MSLRTFFTTNNSARFVDVAENSPRAASRSPSISNDFLQEQQAIEVQISSMGPRLGPQRPDTSLWPVLIRFQMTVKPRCRTLPSTQDQDLWETNRLKHKGPSLRFHETRGEWLEYYTFLRDVAGKRAAGTEGYELPERDDRWAEIGFEVIPLKEKYWKLSACWQLPAKL